MGEEQVKDALAARSRQALQCFDEELKPIFVLYGFSGDAVAGTAEFRRSLRAREHLYLSLNMDVKTRETPGDICLGIVRQFVDALLDNISAPETKNQLFEIFRLLANLDEAIRERECSPDEKLAEFVRVAEISCYPTLRHVLQECQQPVIIELLHFEKVAQWGKMIHNFVLDRLLRILEGVELRFVLFVQSFYQPSLFHGSNEEGMRTQVSFFRFHEAPSTESEQEASNYDMSRISG